MPAQIDAPFNTHTQTHAHTLAYLEYIFRSFVATPIFTFPMCDKCVIMSLFYAYAKIFTKSAGKTTKKNGMSEWNAARRRRMQQSFICAFCDCRRHVACGRLITF